MCDHINLVKMKCACLKYRGGREAFFYIDRSIRLAVAATAVVIDVESTSGDYVHF